MGSTRQSEIVRDALESAILNGDYPPGQKLDFSELETKFSCSRTPIREALQFLENSGLVQIAPKRGTFVTQFSIDELTERFEVMAELEGLAARLAARRMTDAEIDALEQSHIACSNYAHANDFDGYYNENSVFHSKIYKGSKNKFLFQEATRMHAVLHPYRRMQLRARNRVAESLSEHDSIFNAIKSGDAAVAQETMISHVKIQGESFNDFLAALSDSGV